MTAVELYCLVVLANVSVIAALVILREAAKCDLRQRLGMYAGAAVLTLVPCALGVSFLSASPENHPEQTAVLEDPLGLR